MVYFTDKENAEFNPYTYFDAKAIERRIKENLSLYDSTDFPVNENYISTVKNNCDSVNIISRWLNGMSIYATDAEIEQIKKFRFVKETELLNSIPTLLSEKDSAGQFDMPLNTLNLLNFQTFRHKGYEFRKNDFTGKGIRIAVFDVGFPGVDTQPAFEYLRKNNRIIDTYDFVHKNKFVYNYMSHGTMVLSCIAGWYDTIPMGMATDAEFLLAKTERRLTEFANEEDNWLAAAEWADKNGADIISSSLGYTKQRYTPADLNGQKSLVTRAAEMASQKGILVLNAAGNEGNNSWQYTIVPADAKDVLAIGGVNPYTDAHINFSSFGPTADGRIKPNVSSLGQAVVAADNKYLIEFGTSFATPLTAGFAACAWQSRKNFTRAEIFDAIEKSGHLYPYYDYAHGYGIPQADYFTGNKKEMNDTTFSASVLNNTIEVALKKEWYENDIQTRNFYYEFIDSEGKIIFFSVLVPSAAEVSIAIPDVVNKNSDYFFKAHFEGYTQSFSLK